ncbi:hypothetical protein [Flavobacterium sp. 3HN19-14]|uniref:hypothetical protein n=1 Tax=Flavobacterium sp. 3HN19-14 TaxID=3448133 RepID=UPI003EE2BF78
MPCKFSTSPHSLSRTSLSIISAKPTNSKQAYASIPELNNKSRDYAFANNKFEKSNYRELSPELLELYNDLSSERFNKILCHITAKKVFVDPKNHGGGLHQGKRTVSSTCTSISITIRSIKTGTAN